MGTQDSKTTFREVVDGLGLNHFQAPRRVCSSILESQSRSLVANNVGSLVDVDVADNAESRTKLISSMMAYTASLAFFARLKPEEVVNGVEPKPKVSVDQFGVEETLFDGSTIHHLNRDALRASMKCILKVHLKSASNVIDEDGRFHFFKPNSDPFVVFRHGMSMAKSTVMDEAVNPVWLSDHYLFVRKHRLPQHPNEKLFVYILDKDSRMSLWTDDNESLEQLQERDDLLGRSQIELDLSKADGKVKDHEVKFGVMREDTGKEMILSLSTQVLTVDEFCADINKNDDSFWLDKYVIENSKVPDANWIKLLNDAKISYTPIHPLAFFDVHESGTQAWLYGNVAKNVLVLAFPATDPFEMKDHATNLKTNIVPLGEMVVDRFSLRPKQQFRECDALVHEGYKEAYLSIRDILLETIYSISGWSKDWLIIATGHSLGGSLSALSAYEIANRTRGDDEQPELAMFTFGAPSLGNKKLYEEFSKSVPFGFRLVFYHDYVAWALFPFLERLGNAFPCDGTDQSNVEEILNAELDKEGDRRYEQTDTGAWYTTIKGLSVMQISQHDQPSYFLVVKKLLRALFPFMNED